MTYEEKKKFIVNTVHTTIVLGIVYLFFKYVVRWIMPFIIGFFIAYLLKPIANLISNAPRLKNKNKGVSIFVISFFYVSIVGALVLIIINLWDLIYNFLDLFPGIYNQNIIPAISHANDWIISFINNLSPEIADLAADSFNNILNALTQLVSDLSKAVVLAITGFAQKIPIYFITLLFSIICSVLITIDYDNVSAFISRQLPNPIRELLLDIKKILVGTIFKMVKAYFILLFIAFIEMCIGFFILGIENAIPIAALIAILDIIPLIGIGGILVPWGIYQLILGNTTVGIGLIIIYLISYVLRNTLEPKIIGQQIGLSSLATIVAMFAGFRIFGFVGFIIAPVVAIIIKQLNDSKKINLYR